MEKRTKQAVFYMEKRTNGVFLRHKNNNFVIFFI